MKRVIFLFLICFFLFSGVASADAWVSNSSIVSGLGDVGTKSTPTVFLDGSTFKLISGEHHGVFNGYYWNGSTWISDSSIVSGLGDVGYDSAPTVFLDGSTFKLISGENNGVFNGYYWNGSAWVSNSSIISGLGDVGIYSNPTVFLDGSTFKLISGEAWGAFYGYQWNGSAWVSNSSIISGLGDVGIYSNPTVFLDGSTFKLISGEDSGVFNGYTPSPPPSPQITTIQTRITKETFSLTGIVINDVNSTGGFSNEYGYVTLTPTNNSEKIYPITLTGNDLIDGFELQITATGSEVTATPITVNNLGADRTYNIYLDNQFLEKIGEVTTYNYNMTSFSTHILKVEYDIYVPPGDDGGGGRW